jgi:hypothetical protein
MAVAAGADFPRSKRVERGREVVDQAEGLVHPVLHGAVMPPQPHGDLRRDRTDGHLPLLGRPRLVRQSGKSDPHRGGQLQHPLRVQLRLRALPGHQSVDDAVEEGVLAVVEVRVPGHGSILTRATDIAIPPNPRSRAERRDTDVA